MSVSLQSPLSLPQGLPRGRRPSSPWVGLSPPLIGFPYWLQVGRPETSWRWKGPGQGRGSGSSPQTWLIHAVQPQLRLRSRSARQQCGYSSESLSGALLWARAMVQGLPPPTSHSSHHSLRPGPSCRWPQAPIPPGTPVDVADLAGLPSWVLLRVGPPSSPLPLEVPSWAYLTHSARHGLVPSSQQALMYSCVP